jgi:hypothetical protein
MHADQVSTLDHSIKALAESTENLERDFQHMVKKLCFIVTEFLKCFEAQNHPLEEAKNLWLHQRHGSGKLVDHITTAVADSSAAKNDSPLNILYKAIYDVSQEPNFGYLCRQFDPKLEKSYPNSSNIHTVSDKLRQVDVSRTYGYTTEVVDDRLNYMMVNSYVFAIKTLIRLEAYTCYTTLRY